MFCKENVSLVNSISLKKPKLVNCGGILCLAEITWEARRRLSVCLIFLIYNWRFSCAKFWVFTESTKIFRIGHLLYESGTIKFIKINNSKYFAIFKLQWQIDNDTFTFSLSCSKHRSFIVFKQYIYIYFIGHYSILYLYIGYIFYAV